MPAHSAPNFLERAIALVDPALAVERARARHVLNHFGYDGVGRNGSRGTAGGSMWKNGSPEAPRIAGDAIKLMWESRDMERNFCIWDGILTRMVLYSLGTIRWQSKTGDSDVDEKREAYWQEWCKNAELSGRFDFYRFTRLVIRSFLRDRDAGVLLSDIDGELRVQGIEADRIGNPQLVAGETDEKKVQGFNLGDHGRIESVDIYRRTRMNSYELEQGEVPMERFLFVYDPKRLDQYRGVTWGAAAMPHMRDLYETMIAEMEAIKFASSYAGFTKTSTPFGQNAIDSFNAPTAAGEKPTLKVTPGTIQRLTQGEEIVFAPGAQRPSGAFIAFFETKVREIAVGLNLPFGFVWNLALLGGVTARIELGQLKRSLSWLRDIAKDLLLEKVKDKVMRRGVAMRQIPPHRKGFAGEWTFGADITGDAGHDMSIDIQMLENGLISEAELIEGKYGRDFEETVNSQARTIEIRRKVAADTSVPIELQNPRLQAATQLLAGMESRGDPEAEGAVIQSVQPDMPVGPGGNPQDPAAAAPPASGLMVTHGKDAVKGLIDVMKKVNSAEITREQALAILVTSYGMDPEEADAVLP